MEGKTAFHSQFNMPRWTGSGKDLVALAGAEFS
jgi:hypothetical protein